MDSSYAWINIWEFGAIVVRRLYSEQLDRTIDSMKPQNFTMTKPRPMTRFRASARQDLIVGQLLKAVFFILV